jgi:P4 family phage/plasmid primase-like protien
MVGRGWTDDAIWGRVDRATAECLARCGFDYGSEWRSWEAEVRRMAADARAKGFERSQQKVHPHLVAAHWLIEERYPGAAVRNGSIMTYQDGYWLRQSPEAVLRALARYPNPMLVNRNWEDIYKTALRLAPELLPAPTGQHRVCLLNGVYNLDSGELEEHSPDHRLIGRLELAWEAAAECPIYSEFLRRTFASESETEMVRCASLFEEFTALTLVEEPKYQKFLVILGQPHSGKSTLLKIVARLHGGELGSMSAVPLSMFSREYYVARMAGSLVNISAEVTATTTYADAFIKQVTGGDPIDVRNIYGTPFTAVFPVRLIFACNKMFKVRDTSGAVERRMEVLPAENELSEKQIDLNLFTKLQAEMPGIFRRMARAWRRLQERGRFESPLSSAKHLAAFTRSNSSVLQWFYERTWQGLAKSEPETELPPELPPTESTILYLDYVEVWCGQQRIRPETLEDWGGELKTMGYDFLGTYRELFGRSYPPRDQPPATTPSAAEPVEPADAGPASPADILRQIQERIAEAALEEAE